VTGAGFETTASVLRLLIYHLYTSPSILKRLREELSSISVDRFADIELRTLEQLPYLTAVIMEAMRLSPALGTRLQRIAPDRDLIYDKWVIPAGTPVGMTALFMHMDENLYPNPEKFDPERWVDVESRKRAEKVYAPFSRGSRICLGMQ
jgi:cytochrome P450